MKYDSCITQELFNLSDVELMFVKAQFRNYKPLDIFNALLYLLDSRVKWKNLPNDFPPFKTVYC